MTVLYRVLGFETASSSEFPCSEGSSVAPRLVLDKTSNAFASRVHYDGKFKFWPREIRDGVPTVHRSHDRLPVPSGMACAIRRRRGWTTKEPSPIRSAVLATYR